MKKEIGENGITRRDLLSVAGKFAVGLGIAAAGVTSALPSAEAEKINLKQAEVEVPWKYKKIDPDKAAAIAYENWYKNFCAYASASGIIIPLRESVGGPYRSFPLLSVQFGEGGIEGWGTVCGTLLGASVAISLVAEEKAKKKIINDLMNWYSTTLMPVYTPANPKATFKNKTVSESPLCHISVGKWMKAEGVKLGSPERRDRCARLAASVSYQAAVMLNAWADGTYVPSYTGKQSDCGITSQNNCTECHGSNIPASL